MHFTALSNNNNNVSVSVSTDRNRNGGNVAAGKLEERSGALRSAVGSPKRDDGPEKKTRTQKQLQAA